MTAWVLLGCWRPDPTLALDLPPLASAEAADAVEPEADEAPVEAEAVAQEPEAPEVAFEAWAGVTLTAPLTLVDGNGKPLVVLDAPGVSVQVRGDDGARLKVYCSSCEPPSEGYLQGTAVGRK